jgi:hypothetical protein
MSGLWRCTNCGNSCYEDSCPYCGSHLGYPEKLGRSSKREEKEENIWYFVDYDPADRTVRYQIPAGPFSFWPRRT